MSAIAQDDMNPNQFHSYLFIHIIHIIYLATMYWVMYAKSPAQVVIRLQPTQAAIEMECCWMFMNIDDRVAHVRY